MLWPDARRSPSVGTAGATPTPSTDTHATGRRCGFVEAVQEAQAALERERGQRPRRGDDRQGVRGHVGERVGQHARRASPRSSSGRVRRRQRQLRLEPRGPCPAGPAAGRRAATGRRPRRSRRPGRGRRRCGRRPRVSPAPGRAGRPRPRHDSCTGTPGRPATPVAVGDADAVDVEVEPGRAADVDQPDRVRAGPAGRLGDRRVQHGVATGLVGPERRRAAMATTASAAGAAVDRRVGGGVAVPRGVGGGERRGAAREGEVVQRGEDRRGTPPARRRRLDGAQRFVGPAQREGDARVQRRRRRGRSPKRR